MSFENWFFLFLACCGASIVPGPNSLLVVNHVARFGFRKALSTISGGVIGFMFLILVSVFGLAPFLYHAPVILVMIKTLGSFYLAMLGFRLWWNEEPEPDLDNDFKNSGEGMLFKQGFIAAITNVNALMFFVSVLPNILSPKRSLFVQAIESGLTLAFTESLVEMGFALIMVRYRQEILKRGQMFNRVCGTLFFVFAIMLQFK